MASTNQKGGGNLAPLLLIGAFLLAGATKAANFIAPVTGKITSKFGKRGEGKHNGIDIACPSGTPIQAPAPGVIASVYKTDEGGNQVTIKHTNGFTTGYAHLSKVLVKPGEKVTKGETIALSGNTGSHSSGDHLHFTVKDKNGNFIDPSGVVKF